MQLRPPGTPFAQVTGGTATAASSLPANAGKDSAAEIKPAMKMEDIRRMDLILPWTRILGERPMGPRAFGCNAFSPARYSARRKCGDFGWRSASSAAVGLVLD